MIRQNAAIWIAAALCTPLAWAHVGSPDIYADGQAGPYRLSIVVRPPSVIPGVADVEVRAQSPGVDRITITPVPLVGEASKHPPVPDMMARPSHDAQFFTGSLWIMAPGSWQIQFAVTGSQGRGIVSIPLPATALATKKMQPALGALLALLGVLLVAGMAGIVGAATREAKLPPGVAVPVRNRRQSRVAAAAATVVLLAAVFLGNSWWKADAAGYSQNVYKPLQISANLIGNNVLDLNLHDPGWFPQRRLDDFILDHNHLMHLYMIRWPEMDFVFHLHPEPIATGEFQLQLPSMPAGDYQIYADVVHANGFPETIESAVILPDISGRPLAGDDAEGFAPPIGHERPAGVDTGSVGAREQRFGLPDGCTMVWKVPATLVPRAPESFDFALLDRNGNPPHDMSLYMGMLGHAAFVKSDGSVFAHIHPTGTMAMAAYMMANPQVSANSQNSSSMTMDMPGMDMRPGSLPNTVSFPFGFPSAGPYRIIVQMKHGSTVETGIFDAAVPALSSGKDFR